MGLTDREERRPVEELVVRLFVGSDPRFNRRESGGQISRLKWRTADEWRCYDACQLVPR